MLKNLLLLVLCSILFFGCSVSFGPQKEETTEKSPPTEEKTEPAGFKIGDTVVARWTGNSFYEGKIDKIDDNKITVKWNDGSNPSEIDKGDVYALPAADAKPEVAVGDMVLAKIGSSSYWNGAEITKVDGNIFGVKTVENSQSTNVDGSKIIKVSGATAANLKEKGGSTDFLKQAQTKKPEKPSNYTPKPGDKVLAEWTTNSWYSGKFEKMNGNQATIAWDDGSKPSEVGADKVLPLPNASNTKAPTENQYVLAKPASGTKWVYAQTVSVKDKDIEIKEANGKTRTLKTGEVVPLN